jgi:hypothetical protein
MKKFVICNFILMAVFLTACSDESSSSSSSKEDVVSCKLNVSVGDEKYLQMCWQAPKIYEKELKAFCNEATSKAKKGTLSDEACEASNYVRRCDTPKDPLSALYVYDMGFNLGCDDFLKVVENGYEDSDDEEEEKKSLTTLAYYNIPEQRCVQCNAGLNCKSDVDSALGERHPELDKAGVGRIIVEKCGAVAKTPVAICSDNDDDAPLMVYFYDQALKGKKCEELITFVPAKENPLGLDDDSEADDEGDPEADEDGDEPDAEEE